MSNLHEEMRRLVREQPELTCSGLIQQLQKLGWQVELPRNAPEGFEHTPAWVALLSLVSSGKAANKSELPPQYLDPGQWQHVPAPLSSLACDALEHFSDQHFVRPGLPPIELTRLADPLRQQALEAAETAATQTIRQIVRTGHPLANESVVLLMNRCLLRRTYPPQSWSETLRNNNNQHWHQDSNVLYGVRPMLTVWIPLQNGAGSSCPGLETSSVPARFFSPTCGDSTPEHDIVCKEHGVESAEVTLLDIPRGHGAAFNGLTYHRTGLRQGMDSHRDALLLRLCPARDAACFPGDRSNDRTIQ